MKYLGLDLGSRTLGTAISDNTGLIATSYKTIRHNEEYERLLSEVKTIVEELRIDAIVLGFPKNMNNTIGPKGELSLSFKEQLEKTVDFLTQRFSILNLSADKEVPHALCHHHRYIHESAGALSACQRCDGGPVFLFRGGRGAPLPGCGRV